MKTTLVVGAVVAIVVLVGVLAIFLGVGKHSVTTSSNTLPPVSLPSTSTATTTQSSSSTTTFQSSTTSTITNQSQIQPYELYFLNYSNGTYWYVGVLNVSLPNTVAIESPFLIIGYPNWYYEHTYHLYGYTEILLPMKIKLEAGMIIPVNIGTTSGNVEGFAFSYNGYNWTYGNL